MLLSYGIPRAMQSLLGNWRASLNSMLIIAASLSVLGIGVLLYTNVMHFSRIWLSNTTVSLFLKDDLNLGQRRDLLDTVRNRPLVVKAEIVSPQQGLKLLGTKLGANHGLLDGTDASVLPYTIDFELAADDRKQIESVVADFISMPGVEEAVYAERALASVKLFFTVTRGVGLFFMGLILVSFFMIVSNSIKLSLHTRREEIEILWAVGATDRAIRSSFVVEGLVLATLGYLVALVIVWSGYQLVVAALTWNEATMLLRREAIFFSPRILLISFGGAIVAGGIGSSISVSRMMRGIQ